MICSLIYSAPLASSSNEHTEDDQLREERWSRKCVNKLRVASGCLPLSTLAETRWSKHSHPCWLERLCDVSVACCWWLCQPPSAVKKCGAQHKNLTAVPACPVAQSLWFFVVRRVFSLCCAVALVWWYCATTSPLGSLAPSSFVWGPSYSAARAKPFVRGRLVCYAG